VGSVAQRRPGKCHRDAEGACGGMSDRALAARGTAPGDATLILEEAVENASTRGLQNGVPSAARRSKIQIPIYVDKAGTESKLPAAWFWMSLILELLLAKGLRYRSCHEAARARKAGSGMRGTQLKDLRIQGGTR
jgi:hypothetical protein